MEEKMGPEKKIDDSVGPEIFYRQFKHFKGY
jgi:hypothetical protein